MPEKRFTLEDYEKRLELKLRQPKVPTGRAPDVLQRLMQKARERRVRR